MKKQVLGMELKAMSAQETVEKLTELLEADSLSVCALIRSGMLLEAEKNEEYRELLNRLTFTMIGDTDILKALGEESEVYQREIENQTVLSEWLDWLAREEKSIVVLTENEKLKNSAMEFIRSAYPDLRLAEVIAMEEMEAEDDVVNHINGMDVDVVLAELSIPEQEEFIFKNKAKLNIGMWIGMGKNVSSRRKSDSMPGFFEKLIEKRIFKKKVTSYF